MQKVFYTGLNLILLVLIACDPQPAPTPTVEMPTATINGLSGVVGESLSVPVILPKAPNGVAGFDVRITLGDNQVAEITGATSPFEGLVRVTELTTLSVRCSAVDLARLVEAGAREVNICDVQVSLIAEGEDNLVVQTIRMDDDEGDPIEAELIIGKTIGGNPLATLEELFGLRND